MVRGRLRIDMGRMTATLDGRELHLEGRPLMTLHILAEKPGEVVSRNELLERAWGTNYAGFEHSVEQAVHEARRGLREPGWIETGRGIGYRFVPPAGPAGGSAPPALDARAIEGRPEEDR